MKVFWSIVAYMAIGGLLVGIAYNARSERCGGGVEMSTAEVAAGAAAWPALLIAALVVDSKYLEGDSKCVMREVRNG